MNRLAQLQTLLSAEEEGALDGLQCPDCHVHSVSVRYTEPQRGVCRLWFLCSECPFRLRIQMVGKPKHFSMERVDERLQAYDADILAKCHFKLPKDPTSSS